MSRPGAAVERRKERHASRFFLLQFTSWREMNVVEELREREPQPYYIMRWVSIYDDRVLNQDSGLHLIHGINGPVVVGSRDSTFFEAVRSVRFPFTRPRSIIEGSPIPNPRRSWGQTWSAS